MNGINLTAILAIYRFEMARTRRTILQSIISPVISTSLYFVVFGAGIFYILRTVAKSPEQEPEALMEGPTRAAGITPVQQVQTGGADV